jgi:hypothetical protein
MGCAPRLLYSEVAGAPPIFPGDGEQSRFKDAAIAAQELAAAEEEGEATAMMFALLQEQHKSQMDVMAASNQKAMETMFERMNAIIANNGKSADKENNPPAASNLGSSNSGTKRNRKNASTAERCGCGARQCGTKTTES